MRFGLLIIATAPMWCDPAVALEAVHDGAHDHATAPATTQCSAAGPQSPRDLTSETGTNTHAFALAPPAAGMNLCNIHFHKGAEHSANVGVNEGFSTLADTSKGYERGFVCNGTQTTDAQLAQLPEDPTGCEGVKVGDTIEVHWVYSSCDVTPGKGLGSCVKEGSTCQLRVESQVFLLINDQQPSTDPFTNFANYDYRGKAGTDGRHQTWRLPPNMGNRVMSVYRGSTTNPAYDSDNACSPLEVTWAVRSNCQQLGLMSLHNWCRSNIFQEKEGHAPRMIVTKPELLSTIDVMEGRNWTLKD